jgi:hypothetical protein
MGNEYNIPVGNLMQTWLGARHKWDSNIKVDLGETGCEYMDRIEPTHHKFP